MKLSRITLLFLLAGFIACQPSKSSFEQLSLEEATIADLHENYQNGTYTAKDVTEAYLERIDK